ncbi:nuclear transport factor 2 family protein [Ramlibacter sp. AW1]|uniref:Nuclear transport factor 2 family protein n=1 Tax=Ramlibacter aurantiacus TaxID=2801330 RepID=A0A936ZWP7_9BURK|nr:nuclear transport factor 2 family protein [Ramlibacter aurantiacus]MBL0421919.1 nuclear transport factor 2 family protein [Ramlibacter aurantiacus]
MSQPDAWLDEAACTRLCIDFCNHIDARRYNEWLDLFTEDGVLDRMGTPVTGRAGLAAFLQARPAMVETRHLCTNVRVELTSADEATGFCYALFFQGTSDGPGGPATATGAPGVVEYHDRYRRTPQGWRIQERRIRMAIRPWQQAHTS